VLEPYDFTRHEIQLRPGDRVVLFTDGVSEARSPNDGELFGIERVSKVLTSLPPDVTGRDLVDRLERDVLNFTGGIYTDDTAILHFHYLP
jgi:serine phosphatase RsbU (regulator of sigma subunit)